MKRISLHTDLKQETATFGRVSARVVAVDVRLTIRPGPPVNLSWESDKCL